MTDTIDTTEVPDEITGVFVRSIVRTVTPWLVGYLVAILAKIGLDWTPSADVFLLVSSVLSTAFYAAVRYAEVKYSDKFGWLLGSKGAPAYGTGAGSAEA